MGNRNRHDYICLNRRNSPFLDDAQLEDLLDVGERKHAPLRTDNARKSLEHHRERQRLKRHIADFDFADACEDH
jgi:hypothetical protein